LFNQEESPTKRNEHPQSSAMAPGKLFLGGLSVTTSTESLQQHFSAFGEVVDAVSMGARGFGFVTFADPAVAESLAGTSVDVEGQQVECKPVDGKGKSAGKGGGGFLGGAPAFRAPMPVASFAARAPAALAGGGARPTQGKIFIGGLSPDATDNDLYTHFGMYGSLTDAVVMLDKANGKPRGFGFVTYEDPAVVEVVLQDQDSHVIAGKLVQCKRAVPEPAGGAAPAAAAYGGGAWRSPAAAFAPSYGYGGAAAYNPAAAAFRAPAPQKTHGYVPGKLFIAGLGVGIGTEKLHNFFASYGEVVDCISMRERGFGFVTFADPAVAQALQGNVVDFEGRQIECKQVVPEGTRASAPAAAFGGAQAYGGPPGARNAPGQVTKIFLGGLSLETTEDELIAHFGNYGTINDAVVMKDKMTGKPRGFGFVNFDDPTSVQRVMVDKDAHVLGGKLTEVKPAVPEEQLGGKGKGGGKGMGMVPFGGLMMGMKGGKGKGRFGPY